jgi:hypothetical protein
VTADWVSTVVILTEPGVCAGNGLSISARFETWTLEELLFVARLPLVKAAVTSKGDTSTILAAEVALSYAASGLFLRSRRQLRHGERTDEVNVFAEAIGGRKWCLGHDEREISG